MRDIELDLRMELLRVQPELSVAQTHEMIAEIARSYFDIQKDNAAFGVTKQEDFWNLCLLKGAAVVAIYRQSALEILVFKADDTLINQSQHFAACEVEDFLQFIRGHYQAPHVGLQIAMSEALPWMEKSNTQDNQML